MARILGIAAVLAATFYLGICALLYFRQQDLVYFPQATRVGAGATDFALERDDGAVLRGWRRQPGRPRILLYFGGNGEDLRGFRDHVQAFPKHTAYLLAYRGYGASDGSPSEAALFSDALALYDHVHAHHPELPVDVIGRSLGSGVASYLASRRPVQRLALVTPFDSLAATAQAHYRWLPVRWLLRDGYRSDLYLPRHQGRLLILRAGRDQVIPAANTDALIKALPRHPLVAAFPEADHNSISGAPGYLQALQRFLD
ncbi:MAG TPA: alpha/beta hydrolase [Xanthomonadaceae bacterium]|nr:alpha/beta hydrolase [Xanthomonadaceae bacterium]